MSESENKVPGRWLYVTGGALTLIYVVVLTSYSITKWSSIREMAPNSLGDFLAGAFSPLAFAWLVLGFIQQGIELRQNSAALLLQADELRAAATHAGAMVDLQRKEFELRIQELEEARRKAEDTKIAAAQRREADAIKKIQPQFHFGLAHRSSQRRHIAEGDLENHGTQCTDVKIVMEPIPGVLELSGLTEYAEFPSKLQVPITFFSKRIEPRTHPLLVQYIDAVGVQRSQEFIVSVRDDYVSIEKGVVSG